MSRAWGWLAALALAWAAPAQAHLMVAQKGTLNFQGDGAYLLLSLPTAALQGVDDDGDGRLSPTELRAHAARIEQQVQAGVRLHSGGRDLPLQGLMLTLSPDDDAAPAQPASQLVVMGRYALGAPHAEAPRYTLTYALFGRTDAERQLQLTVTRQREAHIARYTPQASTHALFVSASAAFAAQLRAGALHVLAGPDHLLFLLLVLSETLAARRGWRQLLLVLSSFTAGHALTLVGSVHGGWALPSALVEPAIAATVAALALLQLGQARRGRWLAPGWHLGLVFLCALVHGLGLASGMDVQGLAGESLALALLGFNLGIELAQVLVAAGAVALGLLARHLGAFSRQRVAQLTAGLGVFAGLGWLVQRLGAGG